MRSSPTEQVNVLLHASRVQGNCHCRSRCSKKLARSWTSPRAMRMPCAMLQTISPTCTTSWRTCVHLPMMSQQPWRCCRLVGIPCPCKSAKCGTCHPHASAAACPDGGLEVTCNCCCDSFRCTADSCVFSCHHCEFLPEKQMWHMSARSHVHPCAAALPNCMYSVLHTPDTISAAAAAVPDPSD